jgi:hypothetical protein
MLDSPFFLRNRTPQMSILLLLLVGLAFGFSVDRYPLFYVDDGFFVYPALKAALGGPFVYNVSASAPFGNTLWAYHGPVLPNLEIVLFRIFGYSSFLSRLPDFVGGWLAALLILLFLNRRGYRYAGLAFVILWAGDRSVQEIMYGRMDGLALLSVVVSFLCLERAWVRLSGPAMFLCGFVSGFSVLIHPLCAAFAPIAFLLISYRAKWKGAWRFLLGSALNIPVLAILWRFHISQSWAQFRWHVSMQKDVAGELQRFLVLLTVLHWSKFWFVALVLFAIACSVRGAVVLLKRGRRLDETDTDFVLAAGFTFAALMLFCKSPMFPYYIVYFSLWPMLCMVMLAERHWLRFRPLAVVLALIWCSSAMWNLLRLREAIYNYPQLSKQFLFAELKKNVPDDAEIVTTPELYSVPIEAGYKHYGLTAFYQANQDICHNCFLLMRLEEFEAAKFVSRSNLDQRKVIYEGPAFPRANQMTYPVVLLSPELATSPDAPETGSVQ